MSVKTEKAKPKASASAASPAAADEELPVVTCYTADISICSMICRLAAVEHKVPRLVHRNVDIECAMEVQMGGSVCGGGRVGGSVGG